MVRRRSENAEHGAAGVDDGLTGAFILCSSVAVLWVGLAFIHPAPRVSLSHDSSLPSGYWSRSAQLAFFIVSLLAAYLVTRRPGASRRARHLALGIVGTAAALHADVPWFVDLSEFLWQFAWAVVMGGSAIAYIWGMAGVIPESRGHQLLECRGSDGVARVTIGLVALSATLMVWPHKPALAVPISGVILLGSGIALQWDRIVHPRDADNPPRGVLQESAWVFLLLLLIMGAISILGVLAFLDMHPHPAIAAVASPSFMVLVLPPILIGLPLALVLGLVLTTKQLLVTIVRALLLVAINIVYVVVHLLADVVFGDRTAVALNVSHLVATAVVTFVVVLTLDTVKRKLEERGNSWLAIWNTAREEGGGVRADERPNVAQPPKSRRRRAFVLAH